MLSFLKNFFWAPRQEATSGTSQSLPEEDSRKRRLPTVETPVEIKRHKGLEPSWNLDVEQADYRFSKETISIFAGSGATVLVSRRSASRNFQPLGGVGNQTFLASATSAAAAAKASLRGHSWEPPIGFGLTSVLRQVHNLPSFQQSLASPSMPAKQSSQQTMSAAGASTQPQSQLAPSQPHFHSTPAVGAAATASSAAASTVPKRPSAASTGAAAAAARGQQLAGPGGGDDDCVITSMEGPKSVSEMYSPCRYLSPDWLDDIKTTSQSLKCYMQKVESEETVKMQYWAKRRESDERDLVARVTRNLKLSERELPVLPYKYEEPPPTPPPSPPPLPPPPTLEPEFPDLSEGETRSVERAWSRQLPGSEVLAEGFSLRVTREELRSLSGLNWLNDNIVNFYMQLIAAREGPGLPKVHAFSTFFYTKYSSSGYAAVRRWTKKVDIFDRDVLLCPVHLHNNHWTLCIIDVRSRHIIHLDSMSRGGIGSDPTCLPLMRQYLAEEHRDKKGSELDAGEFQLVRDVGAPQQENCSDCGVFCCKFADYYCKGREFTFKQKHMPYFRKRTTYEILEKRLLW